MAGSEKTPPKDFSSTNSAINNKANKSLLDQQKKIQTEANFINKSLTTLGRIIRLIREQKMKGTRDVKLPIRESKLTTLLQDCFGGTAQTVMLVTAKEDKGNYHQTRES